ncbi:MAG: hypothetical protein PF904_09180 [Kiritimatiellae bacterium]|nr:hypothetical protein [Kiritimatiellia bacterium]
MCGPEYPTFLVTDVFPLPPQRGHLHVVPDPPQEGHCIALVAFLGAGLYRGPVAHPITKIEIISDNNDNFMHVFVMSFPFLLINISTFSNKEVNTLPINYTIKKF